MKKIIFFLLTIFWTGFIFANSLKNASESSQDSWVFVEIFQKILNIVNIKISIETLTFLVRKCAHMFEFFMLACFSYNYLTSFEKVKYKIRILLSLAYVLFIATIDEVIQLFTPGRAGRITDVLIDFSGAVIFMAIILLINLKKYQSTLNNK